MDISAPKTGDLDGDYCKCSRRYPFLLHTILAATDSLLGLHNSIQRWDKNCRISHARNTWYFSFMGRQEIMTSFQKAQKERKQERNRAVRQGRFPFSRSSLFSDSD
jgi:hypothetical protein